MSIEDICELSSLLESDDREKTDLQRKNVTLLGSIKQQESRLQHELDAKVEFVQSLERFEDRFENFSSNVDMTMLALNQLSITRDEIEKWDMFSKIEDYIAQKSALEDSIASLFSKCNELELCAQSVSDGQTVGFGAKILELENKLQANVELKKHLQTRLAELSLRLEEINNSILLVVNSFDESRSLVVSIHKEVAEIQDAHSRLHSRIQRMISDNQAECLRQERELETVASRLRQVEVELDLKKEQVNGLCMALEDISAVYLGLRMFEVAEKSLLSTLNHNLSELQNDIAGSDELLTQIVDSNNRKKSDINYLKSEINSVRKTHEMTKKSMNFSEKASSLEAELIPLRERTRITLAAVDNIHAQLRGESILQREQLIDQCRRETAQVESELAFAVSKEIPEKQQLLEAVSAKAATAAALLMESETRLRSLQDQRAESQTTVNQNKEKLIFAQSSFSDAMRIAKFAHRLELPDLDFSSAPTEVSLDAANEALKQLGKARSLKECELDAISVQLATEESTLKDVQEEILRAQAESAAILTREHAIRARKRKTSQLAHRKDELTRANQMELSRQRSTIAERDKAFRQELQRNRALLKERLDMRETLEKQAAQLRSEHGNYMEILRIKSQGHHPLLQEGEVATHGLSNLLAQCSTGESQFSGKEDEEKDYEVAVTPVDKWKPCSDDDAAANNFRRREEEVQSSALDKLVEHDHAARVDRREEPGRRETTKSATGKSRSRSRSEGKRQPTLRSLPNFSQEKETFPSKESSRSLDVKGKSIAKMRSGHNRP